MLVEFGKAGWIDKARQHPDKVRMVLDKIRTDGLLPTVEAVFNKLDQPLPLGYCNVGEVIGVGAGVSAFAAGDRVVSNGKHAEVVCVPANLCARIPDSVADEDAAFTVLAAIGLQGIRLIQPTLGERVVVIGLGLIGLLTVQLLRAQGCRVLGIDFDAEKLAFGRSFGAETVNLSANEDPIAGAQAFSHGRGVDAVLITASSKSNQPVHQAAQMCRKRGRIVLVGVTGLELSRADFYEKELSFQVSCSYGPGRYDPNYEEKGQDYPFAFVRWTEQRNFEAVLELLADQRLDVKRLVSHRFAVDAAAQAYELVGGKAPSLGILLRYPTASEKSDTQIRCATVVLTEPSTAASTKPTFGFIGSGNYATAVLIPAFKASGARLNVVASSTGVSAVHAGRKFGFAQSTTDTDSVFADPQINAVVITTRHDSHAGLVCQALAAGKHVFVEKPLALSHDELAHIEQAHNAALATGGSPLLMVGFNRRFAPQVRKIKALLAGIRQPKAFVMTINAGGVPAEHWTQDLSVGGGRIIGEACHFVDLLRFLAGTEITNWHAARLADVSHDTATLQLSFADGSVGTIHYLANGHKTFPKERLEVFTSGRVLQLDNFRRLKGFGWTGFSAMNLWRQDKGQKDCAESFVKAVKNGGPAPISLEELVEVSRITIDIATLLA